MRTWERGAGRNAGLRHGSLRGGRRLRVKQLKRAERLRRTFRAANFALSGSATTA